MVILKAILKPNLNKIDLKGDPVVLEASGDGGRLPPGGDVSVDHVLDWMRFVRRLIARWRVAVVANLVK